jgi:hypothetical protein
MHRYHAIFHQSVDVFPVNVYVLVEENPNHVYHLMVHIDVFVSAIQIMIQYEYDNLFVVDFDFHIPLKRIILIKKQF